MSRPSIVRAGDSTVVVEFDARIDPIVNQRAIRLAEHMRAAAIAGVRDIVATYRSVAVFFDPLHTAYDDLLQRLEREAARGDDELPEPPMPLRIPVCYGGDFGPDLESLASRAKMSTQEVVQVHTGQVYRVFMLGFLPGFAYMGLVDPRIAAPRHSTPRVRVSKGSVGIAGRQTGIYPADTPGGWQILGRTPIEPFALDRSSPFWFKAGDSVQFASINQDEYERLVRQKPDTTDDESR
jgi:KipI family sensor histidine kinase inhibitor